MTSTGYELDAGPAISLDWTTGEHSRIESCEGFMLVAWSTRLSPVQALRLFRSRAQPEAMLTVLVEDDGALSTPVEDLDLRHYESRADRVRLIRLENDHLTLLWEERSEKRNRSTSVRAERTPQVAVLSDIVADVGVGELIEQTAAVRVVGFSRDIVALASELEKR